ncbi:MAG TPA: hypothetical protein VFR56_06680 [Actinomycetes bacterium]|nr:hypothetical protein [Actinomycetes bacterium]
MTPRSVRHPRVEARAIVAAVVAALVGALVVAGPAGLPAASAADGPLTNLAHLDVLQDDVTPPVQEGHTTYRLAEEPSIGVLWTYADRNSDGTYRRVGGGPYDPATNTWSQGAFNADDVSRAAVVYLRHWRQTGTESSRDRAYDLLRGLTYLQTASGPNEGNVVLWMQPDGTLNPTPTPVELPNPSDSGESYWLARTIWALGEGYAAFQDEDPAFAAFLQDRLDLSIGALKRQTLSRYGSYQVVDGRQTPAWLVVDGADASAEAVLGLAAYVEAGGGTEAGTALRRLSEGIAALQEGDAQHWPFGALQPWALSRANWHAWASQMPAALARAGDALGDGDLVDAARRDSGTFDPWLLTSGGPDNGRLPTRVDRVQIAYGVDSRLQSLLATADVAGSPGARRLAGLVAAWYFGANAWGQPAYDTTTGRTVDGIDGDGKPNLNGGAESTIHGLLSMLALDAHPAVAEQARVAVIRERHGTRTVQAETPATTTLGGGATAVTPSSTWTGESAYGGTGYAALPDGGTATFPVGSGERRLVLPVVELLPGSTAVTTFTAGDETLGQVDSGDVGEQGVSPAPGALLPVTLPTVLPPGLSTVRASTVASGDDAARLDALMVEPLVSRYVLGDGAGHGVALLRSAAASVATTTVTVPGSGAAMVEQYDGEGDLVRSSTNRSTGALTVVVQPGGFTVVRR